MFLGCLANANAWLPVCLHLGVLLFLSCPHSCLPQAKYSTRLVETAYGSVRGIIIPRSGSLTRDVEGFLGVPYASAPAASLRFMPPLTPSHWKGVRVADKYGPVCPQLLPDISNRTHSLSRMPLLKYSRLMEISQKLSNQSEDCLYLNIMIPVRDERHGGGGGGGSSKEGLAVVVILQGDSWEWGSGNLIDGSALASHGNVMVVTLNYRLGVLGFLQTSSQQGNFAIMDVVAALNWIRENAGAFGADVNRVTLLGHRTGAVLVNFLMLAPVATELFHRVILLSGSSLSPWSFQRHAKSNVRKLAQYLGCHGDKPSSSTFNGNAGPLSPAASLGGGGIGGGGFSDNVSGRAGSKVERDAGPCLRQIPLDQLLSGVNAELLHPRFIARFGPLIDNSVVKADFVSEMKLDTNGYFSRIPMLIGTASIESFGELNTEDIEDGLPDLKRDRILRTLVRNVFVFHLNEIYSTIKNEYTDWEKPRKDFIDVRDSILNILSDGLTVAPLVQVASMHSKANSNTFFFHFQYEPEHSAYPHRIGSISEDLLEFAIGHALLGSSRDRSLPQYTSKDSKVSRNLLHYLTNFIRSGDPNQGHGRSSSEDVQLPKWESYDAINQLYMEIGNAELQMRSHFRGHKMALWLNLIPQLHQSGGADVSMLHHNFREEKPEYYEGAVREQLSIVPPHDSHSPFFPPSAAFKPNSINSRERAGGSPGGAHGGGGGTGSDTDEETEGSSEVYDAESGGGASGVAGQGNNNSNSGRGALAGVLPPTSAPAVLGTSECPPNGTHNATHHHHGGARPIGGPGGHEGGTGGDRDLVRQLAASHYHSYGTALGVTIGVGCCLLLLNLLIFLAIYHQKTHNSSNNSGNGGAPSKRKSRGSLVTEPEPTSLCRRHSEIRSTGTGFPYGDVATDEYEEEEVVHHHLREFGSSSTSFLMKDLSSSSGFSSPPIPEPPPPPRSIPPSLAGSMVSIASSASGGILRRPPERERDRDSTGGSMKKRVQIQEISV